MMALQRQKRAATLRCPTFRSLPIFAAVAALAQGCPGPVFRLVSPTTTTTSVVLDVQLSAPAKICATTTAGTDCSRFSAQNHSLSVPIERAPNLRLTTDCSTEQVNFAGDVVGCASNSANSSGQTCPLCPLWACGRADVRQECHMGLCVCPCCLVARSLRSSYRQPANVFVAFQLNDCLGTAYPLLRDAEIVAKTGPDPFLESKALPVDPAETGLTLNSRQPSVATLVSLMVDRSGSVLKYKEVVKSVIQEFGAKLLSTRGVFVSISAFDGSIQPTTVLNYTQSLSDLEGGLERALQAGKDSATNLNGAIANGCSALRLAYSAANYQKRYLVVFTDGVENTGRISHTTAQVALRHCQTSETHAAVVGVGDVDTFSLVGMFGQENVYLAQQLTNLDAVFNLLATKINAFAASFYVLTHCTTFRPSVEGDENSHTFIASISNTSRILVPFSAANFTDGCNLTDSGTLCGTGDCGYHRGHFCGSCALGTATTILKDSSPLSQAYTCDVAGASVVRVVPRCNVPFTVSIFLDESYVGSADSSARFIVNTDKGKRLSLLPSVDKMGLSVTEPVAWEIAAVTVLGQVEAMAAVKKSGLSRLALAATLLVAGVILM